MSFGLQLLNGPENEPLTRAQAKKFAGVTSNALNDLFDLWITAGRQACEQISGLSLISQTFKLTAESWYDLADECGRIKLPNPPLQSVSAVGYIDPAGDTQTLATDDYQVQAATQPGLLLPAALTYWPTVGVGYPNAVQITFVAGYGEDAEDVPADVRDMLLSYVSYRCFQREEPDQSLLEKMFGKFRVDDWT